MRRFPRVLSALAGLTLAALAMPQSAAAQDEAAECSVNLFAPQNLATVSIELQRAAQYLTDEAATDQQREDAVNILREAGRDLSNERRYRANPVGRAFALGQMYILWMHTSDELRTMSERDLGLSRNADAQVELLPTADSLFDLVEAEGPACAELTYAWRVSRPWNYRVTTAYRLIGEGNLEEAERLLNESMLLDANSPFTYNAFAQIEAQRENIPAMLEQLGKAIELSQQDTSLAETTRQMRVQYASVLQGYAGGLTDTAERNRELRRAAELFLELGLESPNDPNGPAFLSQVLDVGMMMQDTALVSRVLNTLLASPGAFPDLSLLLGAETARMTTRNDDAIALYRGVLAKNPYVRDANYFLAYLLLEKKEAAEALPLTEKLIELDPSNPDNYLMRSIALREVANTETNAQQKRQLTQRADSVGQREATMRHKVTVTVFERRANGATLQGTIENRSQAARTYTLEVQFIDAEGNVLDTQSVTTESVAPNAFAEFTVRSSVEGIGAWKYKPLT